MNTKLIAVSILTLATSSLSYACDNSYNDQQSRCQRSCAPSENHYSWTSCSCTDSHCDGNNPCLSTGKCCKYFGNIGDTRSTN